MTTVNMNDGGGGGGNLLLEKNSLVVIHGLQSEAGKKLNGGLGIIINQPNTSDSSGSADEEQRYPVRIFALLSQKDSSGSSNNNKKTSYEILSEVQDKKLKTGNVNAVDNIIKKVYYNLHHPNNSQGSIDNNNSKLKKEAVMTIMECFDKARVRLLQKAEATNDNKMLLFWLATSHRVTPHQHSYVFSYANVLSILEQKHSEAIAIMKQILQKNPDLKEIDPHYPKYCQTVVMTCCDDKSNFDLAVQCALDIPTTTTSPEDKKISYDCLSKLLSTLKEIITANRGIGVEDLARLNVQVSQALLDHDPTNDLLLEAVAGSYCLAGNNLEGAKLYRKAISMGAPFGKVKESLILAQLQCPGMPLEDFITITIDDSNNPLGVKMITCLHKSDKDKVVVEPFGGLGSVKNSSSDTLKIIQYEMPTDPNDLEVFSKELLEQLEPEPTPTQN